MPFFSRKFAKMSQNLLSAAVVIGALSVKPNGLSNLYQLDKSIFNLRVAMCYFFVFINFLMEFL